MFDLIPRQTEKVFTNVQEKKTKQTVPWKGFVLCVRDTHPYTQGGIPCPDQYADADPLRVH